MSEHVAELRNSRPLRRRPTAGTCAVHHAPQQPPANCAFPALRPLAFSLYGRTEYCCGRRERNAGVAAATQAAALPATSTGLTTRNCRCKHTQRRPAAEHWSCAFRAHGCGKALFGAHPLCDEATACRSWAASSARRPSSSTATIADDSGWRSHSRRALYRRGILSTPRPGAQDHATALVRPRGSSIRGRAAVGGARLQHGHLVTNW